MKKTALLMMLITIFSKIIGFARDMTLSYFYGTSSISDAYIISVTVPTLIFGFIGVGISTGYIPMYSKIDKELGNYKSNEYTNNLVNIFLLLSTFILIISIMFTQPIVQLLASGFKGETLTLAVKFTRISLIGIYFTGLIYIFNSYLQLKGNYLIPALVGFPLNILLIISILISYYGDIWMLSVGSVIATLAQFLFLIPFIRKYGYRYKAYMNIKDENIKKMAYIALPAIFGVSISQINALVDTTIASRVSIGGISSLSYANRFIGSIEGVFGLTIATLIYPIISKLVAENDLKVLKQTVSRGINSINILVIPITVGAMIFAEPIVRLLFGRGAFDESSVIITSDVLFYYSIGMVTTGLREVLSRTFYSMQNTVTPTINAVLALVTNIILAIILSNYMGIKGLALATSISTSLCTILLMLSLSRKIGSIGFKSSFITFSKVLLASLLMGLTSKWIFNMLLISLNTFLALIISVIIGAMIYLFTVYLMKIDDIEIFLNSLRKRRRSS